jgi:hypothetical protein
MKRIDWEKVFWQGLGVAIGIGLIIAEHHYLHVPYWGHYTLPQ